MKRLRIISLLLLVGVVIGASVTAQAQEEPERPRVAFIDDNGLQTASPNDPGPDGTSRFANIFNLLGYEPVTLAMDEPLPDDIELIVLIRPQRSLSLVEAARLFAFIQEGKDLLIAVDPNRYAGINSESERDLLTLIFGNDYGVSLRDNILIEPWFTVDSLEVQDLAVAKSMTHPEDAPVHPITRPLVQYDLPIIMWGGRSVNVEPFGVNSFGNSLLYTDTAYGETAPRVFGNNATDPLVYNIGTDIAGRLPIGGVGIDTSTGSRIVLLGDSELLQNQYGLTLDVNTDQPTYTGNFLFAERLAAWLVGLPPPQYPALPNGFTWISVDGAPADWDAQPAEPVTAQGTEEGGVQQVRALHNNSYLYLLAETTSPPEAAVSLRVTFALPQGETVDVVGTGGAVRAEGVGDASAVVPDGAFAAAAAVEARVPMRLITPGPSIQAVCLVAPGGEEDCIDSAIPVVSVEDTDPAPLRLYDYPLATVRTSGRVNLRSGPGVSFQIIDDVGNNVQFAVLGRNEAGDWIRVENGGYSGWMSRSLLLLTTEVDQLAVVEDG